MVKHTQTIRRQFVEELFEFVWPFCEIGTWRVNVFVLLLNLETVSDKIYSLQKFH